jgi:hypothetical protein
MRSTVMTCGATAAMLSAVPAMPVSAQEPTTPRAMLGKVGSDPTGCAETPEAIRRLYAECAQTSRQAAREAQRGAASAVPLEKPAPSGAGVAGTVPKPPPAGRRAERIEPAPRRPTVREEPSRMALEAAECRDILLRMQLGDEPSGADLAYLRSRCRVRK